MYLFFIQQTASTQEIDDICMFFKPDTMELEYGSISISDSLQMELDENFELMDDSMDQMGHLMDDDLFLHGLHSSIESDVAKISDTTTSCAFSREEEDIKTGIRNADCMWSAIHNGANAGTNMNNGGNSAASSFSDTISMPLAAVSNSQNPYDLKQQQTTTTANKLVYIKDEPLDETNTTTTTAYQPMISSRGSRLGDKKSIQQTTNMTNVESIPPGGSLLRKRNNPAGESLSKLKVRTCQRPDTPHSLDDEGIRMPSSNPPAPEFRHNVDLRACLMGSNNISLTSDGFNCINQICQDLQNLNGKGLVNVRFPLPAFSDVLEVLNAQDQCNSNDMYNSGSVAISPPTTSSDCDSDDGNSSVNYSSAFGATGQRLRNHRSHGSASNMMQHITDHSYTRCNDMVDDGPSLDTPSDSGKFLSSSNIPM